MATIGKILTSAGLPSGTNTGAAAQIRSLSYDDVKKMNFEDLRKVGDRVRKVANDNYRRTLRAFPEGTAATDALDKSGGPISMRGINSINDLRSEVMRGIRFMRAQTSTVTGQKEYLKTMEKTIPGYSKWDKEAMKEFWSLVRSIKKEIEKSGIRSNSREIMDVAERILKGEVVYPEGATVSKSSERADQALWTMIYNRMLEIFEYEEDAINEANRRFEQLTGRAQNR